MEIRQLEYFLMVNQAGSFTRAAERLYVSQPAVTNAIRGLEDELGIQLFDRGQKMAILTTEGRIFATHVEQVMHGISNTLEEINAMKNLSAGVLHFGLTPLGGIRGSMDMIGKFRQLYPAIQFNLMEGNAGELCQALLDERLDMAVLSAGMRGNHSLSVHALAKEELVVCCSRRHRFRRQNSISLVELVEEPLILLAANDPYRQQIVRYFEEQDSMPRIAFESGQVQTVKSLIATDCGISILPESLCESDEELAVVPLDPPIHLEPVLVWKNNRHLSHAAAAFLQQVAGDEEGRK